MGIKCRENELRQFCEGILSRCGVSREDAATFSDALLYCSLCGIDSHGIFRLPFYVQRLEEKGTNPRPNIRIVREHAGTALVDGDGGLGQVVGAYAAELAATKAAETGVSFVGVRGSCHYGTAGYYATLISQKNMIGLSATNVEPVMAAWGGKKNVFGNNPLAISVPYQQDFPIVLDISMSRVAGGKVRIAAKNNRPIPKGWVIDSQGMDTEDPKALAAGGALLPLGEHKGYGLAFMLEILAGALTGANMMRQIPRWMVDLDSQLNIGHFFIAIDISVFMEPEQLKERLDWMVHEVKASPLSEGSDGILFPGEIEHAVKRKRQEEGIPISEEVWEDLRRLSKKYQQPLTSIPNEK